MFACVRASYFCMYVCIYVFIYTYIHVYTYMYVCMYTYACMCLRACVQICVSMWVHVSLSREILNLIFKNAFLQLQGGEINEKMEAVAEDLDKMLDHLRRCLKKRGVSKIGFFEFCLDSSDFSRSIENVFYVSFLVNENKARVDIGSDNLPQLSMYYSVNGTLS